MKRTVLVHPNIFSENRALDIDCKEPLGVLYIASYLREKGYPVDIIDASSYGLSVEQTVDLIIESQADLIGFSVVQRALDTTMKIIQRLRERKYNAHITLGGYLPSLSSEYLSKINDFTTSVDSIVIGEGELTTYDLISAISVGDDWRKVKGLAWFENGNIRYNDLRDKIYNLDDLPFPARDLLPKVLATIGTASMFSSRGCYGNCTFCSQNAFDKMNPGLKWRGRSANNVVDEIEYLINKFKVKTIKFNDDNIFGPGNKGKQRVVDICNEILRRNLKIKLMAYCRVNDVDVEIMSLMGKAGFERILLGVESTNDTILKGYSKGVNFEQIQNAINILNSIGLSVIPGFMMFNPYTDLDDLKKSITYLRAIKAFGVTISKTLIVHDSTKIKQLLEKDHKLIENDVIESYHEYLVDDNLAKVYLINKLFWADYIDPMNRDSKFIVTFLKKKDSFNDRHEWEKVLEQRWLLQADLMEESISWIVHNADSKQIKAFLKELIKKFNILNDFLILEYPETFGTQFPQYNVGYFHLKEKDYFININTSKYFTVSNPVLKRCLFSIIGNNPFDKILLAEKDKIGDTGIESIYNFINDNLTQIKYVRPNFPSWEEFYIKINDIINGTIKPVIFENYVWDN